jgi:multiple sugar transport system ATP-binding protein
LVAQRVGQEVVLGTRPECFFMADGEVHESQCIRAKVDLVEMLGAEALVYVQTDAQPVSAKNLVDASSEELPAGPGGSHSMSLVARVAPRSLPRAGEVVNLRYEIDSLHFFDPKTGRALR